jgi:hypothetical protein
LRAGWVKDGASPDGGPAPEASLMRVPTADNRVLRERTHGLLLHDRLGGIWEVASSVNRPEPVPTELK